MNKTVKCTFCNEYIDIEEAIKDDKNYFHKDCLKKRNDRNELFDYICKLYNLKAPGPRIMQQVNSFIYNNNYTYFGIMKTLEYFYEIKKGDIKKSNDGVGIVPFIYIEAQQYYENIRRIQLRLQNGLEEKTEQVIIKVKAREEETRKKIKLEELR